MKMKKMAFWVGLNTLALVVLFVGLLVPVTPAQAANLTVSQCDGTGSTVIMLDAGHGGSDTGAVNKTYNLNESDITFDLAIRTRQLLLTSYPNSNSYKVCFTRYNSGDNPSNTERANISNSLSGKVLVLIHLNGASNSSTDYTQTFWGKRNKDLEFSQAIYNALWNNGVAPSLKFDPVGNVIPGFKGNGVGQFASGALLKFDNPSTLAETVFLTNNNEAAMLVNTDATGNRRQQIAKALADGLDKYVSSHP